MIYDRQDIGDRQGSFIPLTALALVDQEFEEMHEQLDDFVHLQTSKSCGYEFFVLVWSAELNWVYQQYQVIGGDILFHRGPFPRKHGVTG